MHNATSRSTSARSARALLRPRRMGVMFTAVCGLALASSLLATTVEASADPAPQVNVR